MAISLDKKWDKQVYDLVKSFLDKVKVLDAVGARRCLVDLVGLTRGDTHADTIKRDASIALELIQQVDYAHPEQVLIESTSWQGDLNQVKKNVMNDLKIKDFDKVAAAVSLLLFLAETNEDTYQRVKAVEILAEISRKHPLMLDRFQSRFFRLMFNESLDLTQFVAEVLYNIDFHTFNSRNPERVRKILVERFEENLVNAWYDVKYTRHFVGFQVNVENFTNQWIWNVLVKIKQDPGFKALKVDPECPMRADPADNTVGVDLNVIQHKSMKKVTVMLDPRSSNVLSLHATISYKNADGKMLSRELPQENISMDQLMPPLFTTVNVGQTHCKEFFEFMATSKDNRKFLISELAKLPLVASTVKKILVGFGMVVVNDFTSDNVVDDAEFYHEAYYHGQTRIARDEIVIVARISGEDRTLTIMIAAKKDLYLVGLYNKLLRAIGDKMDDAELKELICPRCLQPIDKGATFCPWCTFKFV